MAFFLSINLPNNTKTNKLSGRSMKFLLFCNTKVILIFFAFKNVDWSFLSSLLKVKWMSPGKVHYLGTRNIFIVI